MKIEKKNVLVSICFVFVQTTIRVLRQHENYLNIYSLDIL